MIKDSNISGLFFGLSTIDCLYLVDLPPAMNQKISGQKQLLCAGGPSTNAAIAFSALGGKATLISCLGDHPLAAIARDEFETYAVDHRDICAGQHDVPVVSSVYITRNNGDRTVVSVNAAHRPAYLKDLEELSHTRYQTALFDGQYMPQAIELAKACRKKGVHTIFDGGSWKAGTEEMIQYIDTIICSSAFYPPGIDTHEETLAWLMNHKVKRAAITRGEQSILAFENGRKFERHPPEMPTIRDTLAAGDIFHGAYAYYFARFPNARFDRLLEKSANIAAQACSFFGPRKWIDRFQAD